MIFPPMPEDSIGYAAWWEWATTYVPPEEPKKPLPFLGKCSSCDVTWSPAALGPACWICEQVPAA